MALIRTRNAETARDLAQEILLATLEALRRGALREPDKLAAFVLGIARNVINNHFRSKPPDPLREPVDSDLIWNLEDEAGGDPAGRREAVRQEIDQLEPVDRQILTMTLIDGAKPAEIATRLSMSGDVVRQRKLRAVRKIAQRLSQTPPESPQQK